MSNALVTLTAKEVKKIKDDLTRIYVEEGKNEPGTTIPNTSDGIVPRESIIGPRDMGTEGNDSAVASITNLIKEPQFKVYEPEKSNVRFP
jgi:hypothetical protein